MFSKEPHFSFWHPSPGGFRKKFDPQSHGRAICSSVSFLFLHFRRLLSSPGFINLEDFFSITDGESNLAFCRL